MAQEHIVLGTPPTGTDGDTTRTAMQKCEDNFTDLYGTVGANTTDIASNTASISAVNTALNVLQGFKNKIINGNFDIWQRGTSVAAFTGSNKFAADHWKGSAVGSTIALSQQVFTPGQIAVPNGPSFFHRAVVASTAGAGNYAALIHSLEGIELYSGGTYTLSFWAKADSAKSIGLEVQKNYGSSGTAIENAVSTTSLALTTAWQKFTYTFTVTSNAGKTIAGGNDCLVFNFWFDCGSNFTARGTIGQQSGTFDIAQVQLEQGSVATSFGIRPMGIELSLCQRYYQVIYGVGLMGVALSATSIYFTETYPVIMRAPGTLSLLKTSISGPAFELYCNSWVTNASPTLASPGPSPYGTNFQISGFSGLPTNAVAVFNTQSAKIIDVSAEL